MNKKILDISQEQSISYRELMLTIFLLRNNYNFTKDWGGIVVKETLRDKNLKVIFNFLDELNLYSSVVKDVGLVIEID